MANNRENLEKQESYRLAIIHHVSQTLNVSLNISVLILLQCKTSRTKRRCTLFTGCSLSIPSLPQLFNDSRVIKLASVHVMLLGCFKVPYLLFSIIWVLHPLPQIGVVWGKLRAKNVPYCMTPSFKGHKKT